MHHIHVQNFRLICAVYLINQLPRQLASQTVLPKAWGGLPVLRLGQPGQYQIHRGTIGPDGLQTTEMEKELTCGELDTFFLFSLPKLIVFILPHDSHGIIGFVQNVSPNIWKFMTHFPLAMLYY